MADHGFDLEAVQLKLGSHSVFAPSASAMWLNCSGSLIPNLLADDDAGYDAAEGTVAHGVAERWLKTGLRPTELVGTVEVVDEGHEKFEIEITDSMLDHVERYVDWCDELPGTHYVEQRVDFSRITPIPKQGGTADHIACEPGRMVITDLKFGKGHKVFAKGNTQARLYALGSFYRWDDEYHFETILIRICQPRLDHFDEWEITREELLQFADYAKERASLAWKPDATRTPSPKACEWCKVKKDCSAFAVMQLELTEGVFDDLDSEVTDDKKAQLKERLEDTFSDFKITPRAVETLTTAELATLLPWRKVVENWWKSVEDELEKRLNSGMDVPGYKLVEGRSNRDWAGDEQDALDNLELMFGLTPEDLYSKKLISPAQLEDLLVKQGYKRKVLPDLMGQFIVKPQGKPVMAPMSDRRPALTVTVDDCFDDLDDEL